MRTARGGSLRDRFGFNSHRQNILAGLQMALQLLAQANCQRVYIGGSFITNKEYPNDFDGCYDDMNIDDDLLDSACDEDLLVQKERFGGELFADPIFQGFLQTDRDGNPKGIIALVVCQLCFEGWEKSSEFGIRSSELEDLTLISKLTDY